MAVWGRRGPGKGRLSKARGVHRAEGGRWGSLPFKGGPGAGAGGGSRRFFGHGCVERRVDVALCEAPWPTRNMARSIWPCGTTGRPPLPPPHQMCAEGSRVWNPVVCVNNLGYNEVQDTSPPCGSADATPSRHSNPPCPLLHPWNDALLCVLLGKGVKS